MPTLPFICRSLAPFLLVSAIAFASPVQLAAQDPPAATASHATRAELERLAQEAEQGALIGSSDSRERNRTEAARIRERLRDGDFQVGDRVVLHIVTDSSLTDTFPVRAGRTLQLPKLAEISLTGVLRSELQPYLTKEIGRYLRDPRLQATSLIRVAVLGQVVHPGFFAMSSDVLVSDAIMVAGGPSGEADVNQISVRRGSLELMKPHAVREAIVEGRTLDQLHLRAGDEIVVGERKRRSFSSAVSVVGSVVAVLVGITFVSR